MSWPEALVARLERYAQTEDRAALAALRRSLDEEAASFARAAPYVAPALPLGLEPTNERIAYLVAGLFALHPASSSWTLARALRRVMDRREAASIEGRFVALLGASLEDLSPHLRHAVSLIRSEDLAIDWLQLIEDLRFWSHPTGRAQRHWASDFWASAPAPTPDEPTQTTTTETP